MAAPDFDVVVVGAGTAGANVAHQFGRRGRRVLLVERRPADLAGAQWVNGVLDRHFERAGLAPPSGPERGRTGETIHLRARHPGIGPTMAGSPTVAADMALLGRRLRKLAAGDGVELVDEVAGLDATLDERTGRLTALTLRRDGRPDRTVTATLFVDASGRRGVLRRRSPVLAPWCPEPPPGELCTASDAHHEVADPAGAAAFLERHGAAVGDTVTYVGVSGGFSTVAVSIAPDLAHVGILVGCLANGRYGTGPKLVDDLCAREPWIGARVRIGSGIIPLRRPYARLTAPGLALVGDAACQVFPAHGSGIGVGLVAGAVLAEGVAHLDDPGDERELWRRYQAPFQRELGADLAGYDVLRRASTALGEDGVDGLVRSGIMDEATLRAGLDQRWAVPPPADAARAVGRLARNPSLARVMVPHLARAQAARLVAPRHPDEPDLAALAAWERRLVRLLGRLPQ